MTIKQKVIEAVRDLPDNASIEDAMQRLLFLAKIDRGIQQAEAGQTISQPYTVAFQTELLQIRRNDKVLEIGTGSGYQACILAELGAKVFSVERQKTLFDRTSKFLPVVGYPSIKTFFGDGYKGLPAYAPFDKMIVTAAAPYVPDALLDQLKPGGILVIPVGANEVQIMTTFTKNPDNTFAKKEYGAFRFVPMLEDKAKEL